ncbi:MAG: hypothetical protein WDO71_12095 [Bacteroidota bacterium]
MKSKPVILILLAFFFSHQLLAHALWIETKPTGTKGKSQEVKIYFGEFADKGISLTEKWFSDLKDFSLVLITPDKKEIKLSPIAKTDYYSAQFTPAIDGVYTLVMHHIAKDVYGIMKLDYNSSATVVVGNQFEGNDAYINNNIISLFSVSAFSAKKSSDLKLLALYDKKPSARQEVKVFAPMDGQKNYILLKKVKPALPRCGGKIYGRICL